MAQDVNDKVTLNLPNLSPVEEFTMHEAPDAVDPMLSIILSWPRRHDTQSEKLFCEWLVAQLRALGHAPVQRALGCITVEVPLKKPDGSTMAATTLFAAHVDTVDCIVSDMTARKSVQYDANFGHIFLDKANTVGSCLGADDGVGVWILLSMIKAGVPGGYVFTRGEELGRLGAEAMSKQNDKWLKNFDACVEFDRPRYDEVITHQCGGTRCASDKYGKALANALNAQNQNFSFVPSTKGVFTDNFSWRGLIAECVNIGVGYTNQHGSGEVLDYGHAHALCEAVKNIPWETLPIDREPKIEYGGRSSYAGGYWDNEGPVYGFDMTGSNAKNVSQFPKTNQPPAKAGHSKKHKQPDAPAKQPVLNVEDEIATNSVDDLKALCEDMPEQAAEYIVDLALELKSLRAKYEFVRTMLTKSIH